MKEPSITANLADKQRISTDIVALIKQKIIDGELNPGDRIVETKLARELGISQTPIREAIRQLAGEGVVNIVPNRGSIICDLTAKDVFEVYSYRAVLEGMAIRLAVQNTTINDVKHLEQFYVEMKKKLDDDSIVSLSQDSGYIHYYIFKLSRHAVLMSMFDFISFRIQLINRILGHKYTKEKEVSEHWELIAALKKGDPDDAEKVMREHIRRAYMEFMNIGMVDRTELVQNEWI
ncbi:GntR family transcriptional regulator [Paenibacillus eucommiae]|uniref:DNA-binding GntR family transcriptional regulator n=1 Tax=Paenibacillus eucommiae TaxID=1355755 RepID=A0ABS4J4R7_9BACL|nr:GntR family transcriptional regulator [Paenibacillus eucommiae]MBP1994834.1 DNA-binding GntR family transcriptional regulator [Paenibacillus eucommiae]